MVGKFIYPMSSFIHRLFYFADGTLEITFNNGKVYSYYGITESNISSLLKAKSKGKFFNTHRDDIFSHYYCH